MTSLQIRLIDIAKALKPQKVTGKAFHVSIACKKGRIIKIGWNDYRLHHNYSKFGFYSNYKSLPGIYRPSRHSECHLATKIAEESWEDYDVYNIRINNNNIPAMSAPCLNCLKSIVIPLSPKHLYYTNNNNQFEELLFN